MNFMAEQTGMGAANPFRYSGHAFVDKAGALPLQAADMLAWHLRHFFERALDGHENPRKDYVALTRKYDLMTVIEPSHLLALRQFYANANTIFGDVLTSPHAKMPGLDVAEGIARSFGLSLNHAREIRAWLEKQQLP